MTVFDWIELDRTALTRVLPDALVIVPLGAVEQHGDHLPTGTDSLIAATLARRAAEHASTVWDGDLVLAPTITVGASDHHLPFGGTLSLSPHTLLSVLADTFASMASAGVRRVVLINGHGGNSGVCHAAAAAGSTRQALTVAHIDYWKVLPVMSDDDSAPIPGHAGAFETSMILGLRPELVRHRPVRLDPPGFRVLRGMEVHSARRWADIDGHTDHPERATTEDGERMAGVLVAALSSALVHFAEAS